MAKSAFRGLCPQFWHARFDLSTRTVCFLMMALVLSLTFASCGGGNDEPELPQKQTTFAINSSSSAQQIAQDYGLTAKIDYIIYEYNDSNELINLQEWNDVKDGTSSKTFVAHERATKLVIRMDVKYTDGKKDLKESMYVATVFYLNINGNLIINIDGKTTRISKYNPID